MSSTSNTNLLFQTDHSLAKASFRAAKSQLYVETGNPIKLNSKPLRAVITQFLGKGKGKEAEVWIAESGSTIKRIGLETGATKQIYRGHFGPVTTIDFYTIPSLDDKGKGREVMISGSWDKSFKIWDTQTKSLLSTTLGHKDFVKALIVIPSLKVLITGSSDKDIRIWDLTVLETRDFTSLLNTNLTPDSLDLETINLESTGGIVIPTGAAPPSAKAFSPIPFLSALKAHTRPIERLAVLYIEGSEKVGLVSVDSMGAMKIWEISRIGDRVEGVLKSESRPHENGIFDLVITGESEIWTASGDNSVLMSTIDLNNLSLPPVPTIRIPHHAPVKSILPLSILTSLNSQKLLTGSTDEAIRIIDLSLLEDSPLVKEIWSGFPLVENKKMLGCKNIIQGHSHDIIDLKIYTQELIESKTEVWILSASLDGTLRRWKLNEMESITSTIIEPVVPEAVVVEESLLTAEEEAELAELMMDD